MPARLGRWRDRPGAIDAPPRGPVPHGAVRCGAVFGGAGGFFIHRFGVRVRRFCASGFASIPLPAFGAVLADARLERGRMLNATGPNGRAPAPAPLHAPGDDGGRHAAGSGACVRGGRIALAVFFTTRGEAPRTACHRPGPARAAAGRVLPVAAALGAFMLVTMPAAAGGPDLIPVPPPDLPGATLVAQSFADLDGWAQDDHAAAFATFRASCAAFVAPPAETGPASTPILKAGLMQACALADRVGPILTDQMARLFFQIAFRPFRVVPGGTGAAFYTGYYEPEVAGALTPGDGFDVPVHGRPDDLLMQGAGPAPNSGGALRRTAEGLVPYHDRAAIEDGALAGRGLEVAWLRDPIDLFFMQIQGSARVRLPDGRALRLNYDGYNGHPYLPVGRLLIQRGLVPREEMSMARIRAFMEADPVAGRALRRENRSYVFFKALELDADAGAMGAQGVPLTAGRSIAVDRTLHTYGVPVFVEADLPLFAPGSAEPFRRLVIAQDTGSAIVGPARADIYFGTGREAGEVAGRIRHPGRFTLLVPRFAPAGAGGFP